MKERDESEHEGEREGRRERLKADRWMRQRKEARASEPEGRKRCWSYSKEQMKNVTEEDWQGRRSVGKERKGTERERDRSAVEKTTKRWSFITAVLTTKNPARSS